MAKRQVQPARPGPDRRRTEDLAGQEPTPHRRDQLRLLQRPLPRHPSRVILTATRSGAERNFCRRAATSHGPLPVPTADLDKTAKLPCLRLGSPPPNRSFTKTKTGSVPSTPCSMIMAMAKARRPNGFAGCVTEKRRSQAPARRTARPSAPRAQPRRTDPHRHPTRPTRHSRSRARPTPHSQGRTEPDAYYASWNNPPPTRPYVPPRHCHSLTILHAKHSSHAASNEIYFSCNLGFSL